MKSVKFTQFLFKMQSKFEVPQSSSIMKITVETNHSHAKSQGAWDVGLPVGTVEHEHASEAAEEHPVGISAKLDGNTGAQDHKHYREMEK